MRQLRYRGPIAHLHGRTALVRDFDAKVPNVFAQFDNRKVPEAFGWHPFPRRDFKRLK